MPENEGEAYFPPCRVERLANLVLIHCENEDDAIVIFEMFRSVALGSEITFRKAEEA